MTISTRAGWLRRAAIPVSGEQPTPLTRRRYARRIAPSKYSIGGPIRRRRESHSDTDADQPVAEPSRSEGSDRRFRARGGNENGEEAGWPRIWLARSPTMPTAIARWGWAEMRKSAASR